jgi:hypothetical protein
MTEVYIYGLKDPRDQTIRYVGKSIRPKQRFKAHLKDDRTNAEKAKWIAELRQLGLKPKLTILEVADEENWSTVECEWIAKGRKDGWPLTNAELGSSQPETYEFFRPYVKTALWADFENLEEAHKCLICKATALAMVQHSYIAIKARGGNPKRDFNSNYEFAVGCETATGLLEIAGNKKQFKKEIDEIERRGDELIGIIDKFIRRVNNGKEATLYGG